MLAKATERSEGRSQKPAVESDSRPLASGIRLLVGQFALLNAKFSIFNPSWRRFARRWYGRPMIPALRPSEFGIWNLELGTLGSAPEPAAKKWNLPPCTTA